MSLNPSRPSIWLTAASTVILVCGAWVWLASRNTAQAEEAAITVQLASTPPLEQIRPDADLATLTLTVLRHGQPLTHGHLKAQLMAPLRTRFLTTDFPLVEGTPLLRLESDLHASTFAWQYLFPIRGLYSLDVEVSPVPGGPEFRPVRLQQAVRLFENPQEVRHGWLLVLGLFVLGGMAGMVLARSAAARITLSCLVLGATLALFGSVLAPAGVASTSARQASSQAQQVVQGQDGWAVEVQAQPVPAVVGHLCRLAVWLTKDGQVFPEAIVVAVDVSNAEDDQAVFRTQVLAGAGQTTQSLQLFDGAPHTATITVRPAGAAYADVTPLTAMLPLEVSTSPPPMAVKLRMMALFLGVLVSGMVVGFFLPSRPKELAGA
jgi:hypothetical protein